MKSNEPQRSADAPPEEMSTLGESTPQSKAGKVPAQFYPWFWGLAAFSALLLGYYYWRMDGEQFEILKELSASVVPLGVLTIVVLAVILFGICTATESAAVGALGALYLAVMAKFPRQAYGWSVVGAIGGVALGWAHADFVELLVSGSLGATFVGTVVPRAAKSKNLTRATAEHQGSDFPHGEDDRNGLLALHWLGALLRSICAARRSIADRALGAQHESLAARFSVHRADDYLPARLAAGVDRDHCHLLPDLHSAAEPLSDRPDSLRHHGRGQSASGVPVAAGGDVGFLSERRFAASM